NIGANLCQDLATPEHASSSADWRLPRTAEIARGGYLPETGRGTGSTPRSTGPASQIGRSPYTPTTVSGYETVTLRLACAVLRRRTGLLSRSATIAYRTFSKNCKR